MPDDKQNSPHGSSADDPLQGRDGFHAQHPENRPDTPDKTTGAGTEANPYDKLPRPPEDTRGEVF